MAAEWALLLLLQTGSVFGPPVVAPPVFTPRPAPSSAGQTATPLDSASNPSVQPQGPSVGPADAREPGYGAAPPPTTLPPAFQRRDAILCGDFRPAADGAGWIALGDLELPGPRGPIQLLAGQTLAPGDLSLGEDVAAVLQRDCSRARPAVPPPSDPAPPGGGAVPRG